MRKYFAAAFLLFASVALAVPFAPITAATRNLACASSTASAALASAVTNPQQVVAFNSGTATIFVEFGTSGVTAATTTGYPIGAGMKESLTVSQATHFACIVASGTQTLYVTLGSGD
jgi:hypothetical protein